MALLDLEPGSLDFLPEALVEEMLSRNNDVIDRVRSRVCVSLSFDYAF